MSTKTDVRRLGMLVQRKREEDELTLRDVAEQTGLKIPTISRIERGEAQDLEGGTLLTLCRWLGADPDEFKGGSALPVPPSSKATVSHNTPDVVELYLRADKRLDRKTAAALSTLFRTAYKAMSTQIRAKRS
ncbi:MAG: helix-turn-helix transcriptional regulator [Terriglobales bacterium]